MPMKLNVLPLCLALFCSSLAAQEVDKNYLLGKFNPHQDQRFVQLDDQHTSGAAKGAYLRKETYEAFVRMTEAAKADGVNLVIISATRNYFQQKAIWERKWTAEASVKNETERARKILLFSSMPGTSRHHWGTDMDLNDLNNEYFDSGEGLKIYEWLKAHAHEYGFCQPYTSKVNGRTGYEEERWHWSYTPLSIPLLEAYKNTIKLTDIKDFLGSDTATKLDVIVNYVDGVACK
ncbi:MAG: M15 family metallopeptidase [Cyclobacteriaceae bacterium]|nr:M15 family metallopeptidase [Cyclobacteriaceae bacterium]